MACQYASWLKRRLVIAATRYCSATRRPCDTGSNATAGDAGPFVPGAALVAQATMAARNRVAARDRRD